ncbi:translocation/assembly module TamB domain-containing protein [Thauera sp. Sel9]|uniref:translocation/assembly module TamB domain-containing protein n=1 Tax=Thauera sp. Sel9 TaxID=2974299 RepID=UPI0021E17A7B|nr:translocation/assembly module TamB domain-containing protein [Thauera sp. Sel9]MCV2218330.1 translocation/assembly module TamB domain-containing protein [Thauera sp. Sel9]
MDKPEQPSTNEQANHSPAARRRLGLRGWLVGGLIAVLVVVALVLGAAAWLLGTRSGLDAAIALGQRATDGALRIEGAQGRLLGPLKIDALHYHTEDLRLDLQTLELAWQPAALLGRKLAVDRLAVERIDFSQRGEEKDETEREPLAAPEDLQIPLEIELSRLELGRFELHEWAPEPGDAPPTAGFWVADLSAALGSDGRHHQVRELALKLPQGEVMLEAALDGLKPFALTGDIRFDGVIEERPLEARLAASGTLLAPHVELTAAAEGLNAHVVAEAAPFEPMPLRALKLEAGEIDPSAFVEGLPHAALRLEAELAAVAEGGSLPAEPQSAGPNLAGPFRLLNRQPAAVDAGGIPVASVSGRLDLKPTAINVDELDIRLPGDGRIGGRLAWQPPAAGDAGAETDRAGQSKVADIGQLVAVLELAGIDTRALDTRLPRQRLAGRIDAEADAQRQQAELALTLGAARIDARAELLAQAAGEAAAGDPAVDVSAAGKPAAGGGAPAAGETVAAAPPRRFSVNARLREVDPRALLPEAPKARLNLDLDASGELPEAGLPQAVQVVFQIPDSRLEDLALGGKGRLRLEGERLPEVALDLNIAGNSLVAEGAWGAPGDVLKFALDALKLDALGHGLAGKAGASGRLSGTLELPSGELQFFGEALRLPGGVRLLGVNGVGRLDAGADGPFQLSMGLSGLGPTARDADGRVQADWLANARLSASGTRARHDIELDLATPELDGAGDTLKLSLKGGLQAPSAQRPGPRWLGELSALESAGRFAARLLAPARLDLSPEAASIGEARLDLGEKGRLHLQETAWSPQRSVARGTLTGLAFGPLTRADGQPRRGPGPLVLGADWNLSVGTTLDGQARLFRESGDITIEGETRTRLGLETLEAVLKASGNRLSLTAQARGSEIGSLQANAGLQAQRGADGLWSVPPDAALAGSAELDVPSIGWLGRLVPESIEAGGSLKGSVELGGTLAAPRASGRVSGRTLEIALVDQGLHLSGGEFDASFDNDRVRLDRLSFVSPNRVRPRENRIPFDRLTATPGTFTASGEVKLDSGDGDFSFRADRLPLLQRDDRWMLLSGEGTARSTWTSLVLNADFRTDAGYIEFAETPPPSLSDDVVVLGRDEKPAEGGFALTADIGVNLGNALYLSAMGLETRLAGELKLRMRPGLPMSAIGSIATVGGSYRGYGQSLVIDRGVVNFQGPLDAPGLDIVALRKGLAVEAGVAVSGSAKRPQIRLVSEPNVPDPDKLSWIVLGRAPDSGSGADLGLLLPAAQALLGGPGGGMTEELSRSLGFDSFSIGQGELNSTSRAASSRVLGSGSTVASDPSVAGQVLSLGKRLSPDLFLSFEQSLGGAETLVKLSYQLSRRLSVVARGGTDTSLDLHYGFSFR